MSTPEVPCLSDEPVRRSRRRFLGAGTVGAPALLTLAGQPALGMTCFTPSRNLSRNMSVSQQGKYGECSGYGVASYASGSGWPVATTTAFHPLFAGDFFWIKDNSGNNLNGLRSCTLLEILNLNVTTLVAPTGKVWSTSAGVYRASFVSPSGASSADTITLAKHIVVAYLNCMSLRVPPTVLAATGAHPSCTSIWQDFIGDGRYEVMANVLWDAKQIKDYLTSNGIAPT